MARSSDLLTAKGAKDIDSMAISRFGIPGLLLMENAARGIVEETVKSLRGKRGVAIFCGKGNNGGDGFAAARHLLVHGIKPYIFLAGRIADVKNEAGINLTALLRMKQEIIEVSPRRFSMIKGKTRKCAIIIDALLGVGLKGEVSGIYRDLIGMINASKAYVLSVDIPSGLDATTGRILGCCVKANKTVTFVAKKRGMVIADGPEYCGKVVVKDLGIPV